jgi:hypothetical protein
VFDQHLADRPDTRCSYQLADEHHFILYIYAYPVTMADNWEDLVADKKHRQLESIPKEWLISAPTEDVLDVTNYPEGYGLLTVKEIQITNTPVDGLLERLVGGWSSVEVTTAF